MQAEPGGAVLVLNCGSSSVKLAVVDPESGRTLLSGLAERVGAAEAVLHLRRGEARSSVPLPNATHASVIRRVVGEIAQDAKVRLVAVGHRVVHGGERFTASVRVDADVLAHIAECARLAPLHNPANIEGIRAAQEVFPDLPQVAVFDTAFHQTMPPHAYRYAVPKAWYDEHRVRRYGFHGTSHRYVAGRAAELLGAPAERVRLVTAHLGNGASATAVRDGVSVDTTMGLTPLEGLVMGTRSGDVDPGLFDYLAHETGADTAAVTAALNKDSGLKGLSGRGNDLRQVTAAADDGDADAALALEVFCYRLAKYVAALVVPLGRLDALVFTGGIGENSARVRSMVLGRLGFLGLAEDPTANAEHGRSTGGRVSTERYDGRPVALVVPTDEELMIARDTVGILAASPS